MKILVAYATKTGTTEKAAQLLAQRLLVEDADVTLCDLSHSQPSPEGYDAVAVGGSIRMGMLHRRAIRYLKENAKALLAQPLGVFCCRCGTDDTQALLSRQLPPELAAHAAALASLGGEMEWSAQKGFDRFIVNMITRGNKDFDMKAEGVLPEQAEAFANALRKAVGHD